MRAARARRALDANGQLEDPALQARFERHHPGSALPRLSERIDRRLQRGARRDLRRQVREMLVAGKSDDEYSIS
jgi:hypothetical protein